MMRTFHVYILANRSKTLYVGVTSNLLSRVYAHKTGALPGFTKKYRIDRLVHFEEFGTAYEAITREKQLKGWLRERKLQLVESRNPEWEDLSDAWYDMRDSSLRSE